MYEICGGRIWREPDGLICEDIQARRITGRTMDDLELHLHKLAGDEPFPLLADIGSVRQVDEGVWKQAFRPAFLRRARRMAIVVPNPAARFLGSFFLRYQRGVFPASLFENVSAAVRWVRGRAEASS